MSGITLAEMFDDPALSRADRAERLELYKAALAETYRATAAGEVWYSPGAKQLSKGVRPDRAAQIFDSLSKSLTGDMAAQLGQDIEYLRSNLMPDLQKDWTLTNPVSDGLVPYDLEAPAKLLVPRYTPLRNTIPRLKGQGTARQYKRILSFTNSGQASAQLLPFFDSTSVSTNFNGLNLNRPQKIAYTGDSQTRTYVELGFSDLVGWKAYFAGLGFDDLLSLSHTALLWSHLMGEERADLYARGETAKGYSGTVAAPTISAGNAGTGGTLPADTYHCYVVGRNGQGQTLASAVASTTTAGATSTITVTVTSEPVGAIYYDLYVGDGALGFANARFQTQFVGDEVTITSFNASGALGVDADTSFDAKSYDGFYTVQSGTESGYFKRINADWSTAKPGSELETALVTMWTNNGADPEEIQLTGKGAESLGELMRVGGTSGAASGYRTTVQTGDGNVVMGAAVTGMVNPVSRRVVDIGAHRFALPGTALIRSRTLPIQDSEVPAPAAKINVQDYMAIKWPTIQMSQDTSTYQYGTLIHYAPAWSGLLAGITNG